MEEKPKSGRIFFGGGYGGFGGFGRLCCGGFQRCCGCGGRLGGFGYGGFPRFGYG